MAKAPPSFRAPWFSTPRQAEKLHDDWRGTASSRGYGKAWRKARDAHLAQHPLCVCCLANGFIEAASLVDHVVPHKGDMKVFWNVDDWQSLCDWCHKAIKAPIEHAWLAGHAPVALLRLDRKHPDWLARPDR
jgi:5-methylcytosine-specific restriction enzyme A